MFNLKTNNENTTVSRFRRASSTSTSNGKFQQTPVDRIVEVLEVHPASNGEGYLIGRDVSRNKKFHIVVSDDSFKRQKDKPLNNAQNAQNILGWLIDDKFEAAIRKSKYFSLSSTKFVKKHEVVNGEEIYFISTEWIRHIEDYQPNKHFRAAVTCFAPNPYSDQYVKSYQIWGKDTKGDGTLDYNVIAMDFTEANNELLLKESESFDEIRDRLAEIRRLVEEAKERGEDKPKLTYPVAKGFQVRCHRIVDTVNEKGETVKVNELVERYPALFKTEPEQDASGNIVKPSEDISGDYFINFIKGFFEYACAKHTKQDKSTYNLDETKGPLVIPDDILVEVSIFENHICNTMGKDNTLNDNAKFPTPLQRMARKLAKAAPEDSEEHYYQGMNLAVDGIVEIVGDTFDMKSRQLIERNVVRRIYANGRKMDINYFLPATNGLRVIISDGIRTNEELDVIKNGFNVKPSEEAAQTQNYDEISDDVLI